MGKTTKSKGKKGRSRAKKSGKRAGKSSARSRSRSSKRGGKSSRGKSSKSSKKSTPKRSKGRSAKSGSGGSKRKAGRAALIRCECGAVELKFHCRLPRFRLECYCSDCRDFRDWQASQKGFKKGCTILDAWYFENDFTVMKGEDNIKIFKYNDTCLSHRYVCGTCFDMVMVDHPFYQKHVTLITGSCIVDCDHIQNRLRFCLNDCPEDEKDHITTKKYMFGNYLNASGEEMKKITERGKELGFGEDTFNFNREPSTNLGTTTQALAEKLGITNLKLKSRMQTPLYQMIQDMKAKAKQEAEG